MAHHLMAQAVHEKVVAAAPTVRGVSLGVRTPGEAYGAKSTWVIHFKPGTHQTTKDTAYQVIEDFNIPAEEAILEAISPSLI